jgi:hypothetical protein
MWKIVPSKANNKDTAECPEILDVHEELSSMRVGKELSQEIKGNCTTTDTKANNSTEDD